MNIFVGTIVNDVSDEMSLSSHDSYQNVIFHKFLGSHH